jgi:hypothetical protein
MYGNKTGYEFFPCQPHQALKPEQAAVILIGMLKAPTTASTVLYTTI